MKEFLVKIGGKIWSHKFLFFIAILIIGGAVYFGYSNSDTGSGDEMKTATIERGDIEIVVTGTGQVYAESQVDLQGVKAGDGIDVIQVVAQNNQEVKKNDLIAVLDTRDAYKSVRDAELNLESAKIQYDAIKDDYDDGKADSDDKKKQKIVIQQRENALADAKENLADYYIRAPFDGIVTGLDVEVGDSISQNDVIASVITKEMYAKISLNEVDAAMVREGNKVTLTFDALPGITMEGKIRKIDTIGEVSQNVVSYNAEISFESVSELLKPGMSVNAEISIESRKNVLQVSSSAIKTDSDGSSYVQVLKNDETQTSQENSEQKFKIEKQVIETGLTDDVVTEIVGGNVSEGDIIVIKMNTSSSSGSNSKEAGGLLDSVKMGGGQKR